MTEIMCNRHELPIDEAMEQCDWPDEFHEIMMDAKSR